MLADIERIHGSPIIGGVCTSGGNETPILVLLLWWLGNIVDSRTKRRSRKRIIALGRKTPEYWVMELAGYKTISILSLIVVVGLAGLSPAFADSINIIPAAACPGVSVILSAEMTPTSWFTDIGLSSDPAGLISEYDCGWNQPLVTCDFAVSESACAGPYTVTVTLDAQGTIVGTADVQFTVGTDACPNVPPCSTAAVGGCVQPVNTFTLLSPWLAVIGLVGCIGTLVVVARKHRRD